MSLPPKLAAFLHLDRSFFCLESSVYGSAHSMNTYVRHHTYDENRMTTSPCAVTVVTTAQKGMDNGARSSCAARPRTPAGIVQGRQL
jgi:hypothetical protein